MRTWILQSNPSRVDLDAYLLSGEEPIFHGVKRYADLIAASDRVYLWRAKGRASLAPGIVAVATVIGSAEVRPHPRDDFVKSESAGRPKLRVPLRLEEVRLTKARGMILRDDVRRLPEMRSHPIVTSNTGTDFALTEAQAASLAELWVGQSLSSTET